DLSEAALEVATLNADRHGVREHIGLIRGNLLAWLGRAPDVVVTNLPYIPSETLGQLPLDVRGFEPIDALDGGPGGAVLGSRLLERARRLGAGAIVAELDPRHAAAVLQLARKLFPDRRADLVDDLAGLPRVLRVR